MAGRIQEGDAHYKEADGLTKKTFTRWKPEWVGAALGFEKAAKCYKAGKSLEKQVDANQRWAQALCESNAFYNAGNALLSAAQCMAEMGNLGAAVPVFEEAERRFREGDSEKAAANALLACGKALQTSDAELALTFFDRCLERFADGDALLHSRDAFNYIVGYLITNKLWDRAIVVLEQQLEMGLALDAQAIANKAALMQCCVYLVSDRYADCKRREDELRSGKLSEWLSSSEKRFLRSMLSGWELGDQEMYAKGVKDVALCLTGQLNRLLKALTVPEGGIDLDYEEDEPQPEGEDDEDPDGIC